jgi:PAS domain S-box-containing protein
MNLSSHDLKRFLMRISSGGVRDNHDLETQLRFLLINIISLIGIFFLAIFGINVLIKGNFALGLVDLFIASVLIIIQIHLRKTGTYASAEYLLIGCAGTLFLYNFVTGGVHNTGHLWIYTFPLFSSFLLGSRKGAVANSVLLTLSAFLWAVNPLLHAPILHSTDFLVRFIISFSIISLSSYFFERFREKTQRMLTAKNAELDRQVTRLQEAEEALQKNQDDLERRVQNRTQEWKLANEELQKEILEHKKTGELFRASEEKYRLLFDNSFDIIYSIDRQLTVVSVSPSVERALGYKPAELIGRPIHELNLMPLKDMELAFSHIMRVFGGESISALEYEFFAKDGTCKIAQVSGAPLVKDGEVVGLISIARDITEAKKAEECLRRNEREAQRLAEENGIMAEIGKIINSSLNVEEVYKLFSEIVNRILPYDRIVINLINRDGCTVTNRYVEGISVPGRNTGEIFPIEGSLTGNVIQNRKSFLLNSQDESEISGKYPGLGPEMKAGSRSFLSVPLISRNQPIGGLHFRSNRYQAYSEKDLKLAESIAAQVSGAIANAQLFAELKRTEGDLRHAQAVLEQKVQDRTKELVEANKDLKIEISERLRAEREMKRAKEEAESANRAKSDFLANMSHELRTPLNHIIGFTELVVDKQAGELNETQAEYLGDVLGSSRHLLSLINDILDLSKVEAGKLQLEVGEVFLPTLLQNSLNMIKEKSMKHGIQLQMEIDGIPERIRGDERKLKQILYNLLSNAVKFTSDGGAVTLDACRLFFRDHRWIKGDGSVASVPFAPSFPGEWVGVSIRDTGIGLKKEDLERIFAPFEQADNSARRRYQGTGLGLSLTRKFVELHGGKIWAESDGEGKGSDFKFLIPVESPGATHENS